MDETKKGIFRHIVKVSALLLCVLFFVLPLVKCSSNDNLTASGWEIATGTGDLYKYGKGEQIDKFVFVLLIIPVVLLILAFTKKSFKALRNISIVGLAVKITFLSVAYIKLNSSNYKNAYELTPYNWFIVLIYIGLVCFMQYCVKQEETTKGVLK